MMIRALKFDHLQLHDGLVYQLPASSRFRLTRRMSNTFNLIAGILVSFPYQVQKTFVVVIFAFPEFFRKVRA